MNDYEAALWFTARQTALGSGDIDTACAITGGIVVLRDRKIPEDWLRRSEPLPEGFALGGQ